MENKTFSMASFAGDSYQKLEEDKHRHIDRLDKLHHRIKIWKQVGPAVSEVEWEHVIKALQEVELLVTKCNEDITYKVSTAEMNRLNHYYRLYKIGK